MSLSGNLGFVSLDEVLRLLTRSNQQGSVDVTSDEVRGRIFVTNGGIVLATTWDDAGMRRHLLKSGMVDEAFLASVEAGEATLAPPVEKSGGALTELIREVTVESLYQIGLKGDSFQVRERATTPYANPDAFDLETLLGESKQRLTDWADVAQSVGDLDAVMSFIRDLGDRDEVRIDSDSWRVLSEIGAGSSVITVAEELGTTEFWTARIAARLLDQDLIGYHREPEPKAAPEPENWTAEPVESAEPVERTGTVDTQAEEDLDPSESWWAEPVDETADTTEPEGFEGFSEETEELPVADTFMEEPATDQEPEVVTEEQPTEERKSIFGAYKPEAPPFEDATEDDEIQGAAEEEVEEDTEAFLEKVFSELETPDEESESEGYGLLRRRRLGAIRDTDS